jgi:hypothetical protein
MKRRSLLLNTSRQKSNVKDLAEEYKSVYHVQTKTAKKGLFGLAPTGTDANVFIKLHDNDGKMSESIELKDSINHKDKFARGKIGEYHRNQVRRISFSFTDDFDVGSIEELNGVDKVELWTDGKGVGSG